MYNFTDELGFMKTSLILSLVFGSAVLGVLSSSASSANALVFNVNSTNYDITTVTGTANGLSTLLQSQPWWGSSSQSFKFALAVGSSFGFPNFSNTNGPLFADAFIPNLQGNAFYTPGNQVGGFGAGTNLFATYAIATPVPFNIPGGATIPTFGSLFALGAMRKVRKYTAKTRISV